MKTQNRLKLFVIAAYPNTGMSAIILPTLGMAGGKWDSSLCSPFYYWIFFPLSFFLRLYSDGMSVIFLHAFSEVTEVRANQKKNKKTDDGS